MEIKSLLDKLHNKTKRDYLKRVNDKKYPKFKAAQIAKKWGYDYWDGDRRINYGGYKYIPGRWTSLAKKMIKPAWVFDARSVVNVDLVKKSGINMWSLGDGSSNDDIRDF